MQPIVETQLYYNEGTEKPKKVVQNAGMFSDAIVGTIVNRRLFKDEKGSVGLGATVNNNRGNEA
jgi:hypothetical protein